jgi:hypothetical protein
LYGTNKSENRWHTSSWRALELESLFGRRQATKSATEVLIKRLSHRMVQLRIHGVDVRDVEVLEHRPVRIVEGARQAHHQCPQLSAAAGNRSLLASAAVVGAMPVARRTRLPSSNSHRSMAAPA